MTNVALLGAGGKMGLRITDNLKDSPYEMSYVEVSEAGRAALAERGLEVSSEEESVPRADFVIMAVPDDLIGEITESVAPRMREGAVMITLDPAAAYLGEVSLPEDGALFVTHPCHPPLFGEGVEGDHFGGSSAPQSIVCALVQGEEEDYEKSEELARRMYAPVERAHRVSLEGMAFLEPSMAETVGATCVAAMREAMEEAIKRGVPREAARDFMLGHAQIEFSILFDLIDSPLSDAAKRAVEWSKGEIFQEDWKKVFREEKLRENLQVMLHPEKNCEE